MSEDDGFGEVRKLIKHVDLRMTPEQWRVLYELLEEFKQHAPGREYDKNVLDSLEFTFVKK